MKTILQLLFLSLSIVGFSQYTSIPDTNFENSLEIYDDIPNDGQVPTANINTVIDLNVQEQGIEDLTGIEGFVALEYLNCSVNFLTNLDLSQNTNLKELTCNHNDLINLNISQNTMLTYLYSPHNNLISLDVSQNIALINLICNSNEIISLDVSQNTSLTELICSSINQLTSLDVRNGNNHNISYDDFISFNNPNLTCIFVDDVNYSTENWDLDSNSTFVETQEECNTLSMENNLLSNDIITFANPISDEIVLSINTNALYKLYTINGKILLKGQLTIGNNNITTTDITKGLYFLNVITKKGVFSKKIIKK